MKETKFTIDIRASATKVHKIMLDKVTYQQWTKAFSPTSDVAGNWEIGSNMHFLSTDKNGTKSGLVATIEENIPGQIVVIKHIGVIENGKEVFSGPDIDKWIGAYEIYRFSENNNMTTVTASIEMSEDDPYQDYMNEAWPKALHVLKELSER